MRDLTEQLEKLRVADGLIKAEKGASDHNEQNRCTVTHQQIQKKKQVQMEQEFEALLIQPKSVPQKWTESEEIPVREAPNKVEIPEIPEEPKKIVIQARPPSDPFKYEKPHRKVVIAEASSDEESSD